MAEMRWLPLESNPEVMNKYVSVLGMPSKWQFTDVWGLEPDMTKAVPRPVLAVLLLYPLTDKAQGAEIGEVKADKKDVYFMRQTIGNACGTVGLIHALLNNTDQLGFEGDSHLTKFLNATSKLTPDEKGKYLETDTSFGEAHEESAQEGQTQAPSRDENVKCHFVTFVHNDGSLYEMDGRRDGPVFHGKTTKDTLLEDTAQVVKKFMARDPDELNFTVVALVPQS